jgi:hypothetical protein
MTTASVVCRVSLRGANIPNRSVSRSESSVLRLARFASSSRTCAGLSRISRNGNGSPLRPLTVSTTAAINESAEAAGT